jgi:hypothetical protein
MTKTINQEKENLKKAKEEEKARKAAERTAAREMAEVRSAYLRKVSGAQKIPEWAMTLVKDPAFAKCFPNLIYNAVAEYLVNHPYEIQNQLDYIDSISVDKNGISISAVDLMKEETREVLIRIFEQFVSADETLGSVVKWIPEYDNHGNLLNGHLGWRHDDYRKVSALVDHTPKAEIDALCSYIVKESHSGRSVAGIKILDVIKDASRDPSCAFKGFLKRKKDGTLERVFINAHNLSQGLCLFFAQRISGSKDIIPLNPRELVVKTIDEDIVQPGQFLK